jgi:hypothetical protein
MDASYFITIASIADAQRGEHGVDYEAVDDLAKLIKGWTEPSLVWQQSAEHTSDSLEELRAHEEAERKSLAGAR